MEKATRKKNISPWIKALVFLLLLLSLVLSLQGIFNIGNVTNNYLSVAGFHDEPRDTLDAVYIGGSNVYYFWQPSLAWQEYGMAVYSLSTASMPVRAFRYEIEEARKTQPDALFILSLNSLKTDTVNLIGLHSTADCMPLSGTKVRMVRELAPEAGLTGLEQLECYFPSLRFHSSWPELDSFQFTRRAYRMKGEATHLGYLNQSGINESRFFATDARLPLDETQSAVLTALLDYCDSEQLRVLFTLCPQAFENESDYAELNTAVDTVRERGYEVLDLRGAIEEMDLDLHRDFLDLRHTNVHGAVKFTHYLGAWLRERYGFADKRGDPAYASWDAIAAEYQQIIAPYTLDFERDHVPRAYELEAPELTECRATGRSFRLTWTPSEGADGYRLYRKQLLPAEDPVTPAVSAWVCVADLDADTLTYMDRTLALNAAYTYTVAPYLLRDGEKRFGPYDYAGKRGTTVLNAPKLLSLEEGAEGMTLSWAEMNGTDGYVIYRKIPGRAWVRIAVLEGPANTYTDRSALPGVPYQYSVGGYQKLADETVYGYYHHAGLLRPAALETPEPRAERAGDGSVLLRWDAVEGASHYAVYRQTPGGDWEQLGEDLPAGTLDYTVGAVEAAGDGDAVFRVSALIRYESERYEYPSDGVTVKAGEDAP